jgi:Ca2+-binding EF-hand superfamily protein
LLILLENEKIEKLAHEKDHLNKEGDYDTKINRINAVKTLEHRVNLDKIQEVRQCLRRRYASRNNTRKIFKEWDKQNSGHITIYDAYKMINKLSIPINIDETRALISSSNTRKTENLNMEEFMHLIYNDNDELTLRLKEFSN